MLEALREIFPKAPVYTLIYDKKIIEKYFKGAEIRASFLQKIPFAKKYYRFFPLLMPAAIEQFDLSYYDLVVSDSSSFAKGIITKPRTKHICYCHTPTRFAWDDCQKYADEFGYYPKFLKKIIPIGVNYIRIWDSLAANRADYFIANSKFVASRIKKYYNKNAEIIHPPVNVLKIQNEIKNCGIQESGEEKYFLAFSRMLPNKRLDLVIDSFNKSGLALKIAGAGPLFRELKNRAKSNIEFLGFIPEENLPELYKNARAFIHPQIEDFGITALEAAAAGAPAIAFKEGGALETVIKEKTGVFFNEQTPDCLSKAVERFLEIESWFNPEEIMEYARMFDKETFKEKIRKFIENI